MKQILRSIGLNVFAILTGLTGLAGLVAAEESPVQAPAGCLIDLGITPMQKEKILVVMHRHSVTLREILTQLLQYQKKLVDGVLAEQPEPEAIRKIAGDIGARLGDFGFQTQQIVQELGVILNDEQKAKLAVKRQAVITRIDHLLAMLAGQTVQDSGATGGTPPIFGVRRAMVQKLQGQLPTTGVGDYIRPEQVMGLIVLLQEKRHMAGTVLDDLAEKQRAWTDTILLSDSSEGEIRSSAVEFGRSLADAGVFASTICGEIRQQLGPEQKKSLHARLDQQRTQFQTRMEVALTEVGTGKLLNVIIP